MDADISRNKAVDSERLSLKRKHEPDNVTEEASCSNASWGVQTSTSLVVDSDHQRAFERGNSQLSLPDQSTIATLLKDLLELVEERTQNYGKPKAKKQKLQLHRYTVHEEPPDDFRHISVFPQQQDIQPREELFLRPNLVSSAYRNQNHYLDVQFRLLREDFVRPLRERIRQHVQRDCQEQGRHQRGNNLKVYEDVTIQSCEPSSTGMLHQIHFNPSPFKWVQWEDSERLTYGNLLCLSSDNFTENILFATVAQRNTKRLKHGYLLIQIGDNSKNSTGFHSTDADNQDDRDEEPRGSGPTVSLQIKALAPPLHEMLRLHYIFCLMCELCEEACATERVHLEQLHVTGVDMTKKYTMLESEAYFEAYRHVLARLQETEKLPLERYIVRCATDIYPPAYLHDPYCDFSSVLTENNPSRHEKVNILNDANWPSAELLQLNESQRAAVMNALTKELSIIQGPPGTGKTHVGCIITKLLLKNKKYDQARSLEIFGVPSERRAHHSPILVVCYTNHALDQFLEKIVAFHPRNVVRVGGRCKSAALEKCSLLEIKKKMKKSQAWMSNFWNHKNNRKSSEDMLRENKIILQFSKNYILNLDTLRREISEDFLGQIKNDDALITWLGLQAVNDWSLLKKRKKSETTTCSHGQKKESDSWRMNLLKKVTAVSMETHEEDFRGGWRVNCHVKRERKLKLKRKLDSKNFMTDVEMGLVEKIHRLPLLVRWRLYRRWLHDFRETLKKSNAKLMTNHRQSTLSLERIRREEDIDTLKKADVIGVTTTGASKYRDIIHELPIRVMIVEEAAEVMEAHVVAAMPKTTEHLILIGDHQQLRPSPTVYELAKNFNLDVSLFERMIKNNIPFTQLQIQHRMRPRIADLLRLSIYPNLQDHASVQEYEDIVGVRKNVYFITHNKREKSSVNGKSKANQHEADFMLRFCEYLLHRGFRSDQITIIAAYSGQLIAFRKAMKDEVHKDVQVTTIDSFQGEENDIILLSLVRSADKGNIGFLKTENRVCVALSRARKGLYCIGNFELLQEQSKLWNTIVENVKQDNSFGSSLPLTCHKHLDYVVDVTTVEDFDKLTEGGCDKPCDYILPCGHVCMRLCHANDPDHKQNKCKEPCERRCHTYVGHDETEPVVKSSKTIGTPVTASSQGSEEKQPVSDESSANQTGLPIPVEDQTESEILLPIESGHSCQKLCYEKCGNCLVMVDKVIPSCNHEQSVPCFMEPEGFECKVPCSKTLPCSHRCTRTCGQKCTSWCTVNVTVTLPCGHHAELPCYKSKTATQDDCTERCDTRLMCGHWCSGSCRGCFQGRLHVSCNEKCTRVLVCGHECTALCAQSCPPCSRLHRVCCEEKGCKTHQHCKLINKKRGNRKKIDKMYKRLSSAIRKNKIYNTCFREDFILKKEDATLPLLNVAKVQFKGLSDLAEMHQRHVGHVTQSFFDETRKYKSNDQKQFKKDADRLAKWLKKPRYIFCDQENSDLNCELNRLKQVSDFLKTQSAIEASKTDEAPDSASGKEARNLQTALVDLRRLLFDDFLPYCDEKRQKAESLAQDISKMLPQNVPGLGITENERKEIVQAMNFNKGHWYKCPNGHVYCIGEYEGATQQSVCPECKAIIG